MFVIVPDALADTINAKLDEAFKDCPDAERDREHLYSQLLTHFDEFGVVPEFSLVRTL